MTCMCVTIVDSFVVSKFNFGCPRRYCCLVENFQTFVMAILYSGAPLRQTPSGPTKMVHYREGVLWSGVYYTLCGSYLGFSKCPLERDQGCPLRGVPL